MKNIDEQFKFVIVGGGTAGWISALFVEAHFPNANITLIQSSDIGILGAGEGTTPHIIDFLDQVDIPISYLAKTAKATIKNGIRFSNWNGDNKHYYHAFREDWDLDHTLISELPNTKYPMMDIEQIALNKTLDEIDFSATVSENNCVRFVPNPTGDNKDLDPILHFNRLGRVSLHFDANLLAKALQDVGVSRGIKVVDGIVDQIITDDQGYITSVKLGNLEFLCDFVFDCTGFRRLIMKEFYKSDWKCYKPYLPAKRAMPFFKQNDSNIIPPYTDAVAMKWGWMWDIPVQGRHGCGYVFDSDRISDEEAKRELDETLGYEVEVPRLINFEPGRLEKIYHKNCLAIGLSAGFIEPLEATSIWTSLMMLNSWYENISGITHRNQRARDTVNGRWASMNENTLGFVYFHYITKRTDTEFWTNFTKDNKIPETLNFLLEESKYGIPSYDKFKDMGIDWAAKSFYACGVGQHFFNQKHARDLFDSLYTGVRKDHYDQVKLQYLRNFGLNVGACADHYLFLEYLKANS